MVTAMGVRGLGRRAIWGVPWPGVRASGTGAFFVFGIVHPRKMVASG